MNINDLGAMAGVLKFEVFDLRLCFHFIKYCKEIPVHICVNNKYWLNCLNKSRSKLLKKTRSKRPVGRNILIPTVRGSNLSSENRYDQF